MSASLSILAWTLVLAFVQILATFVAKAAQYGPPWAFSSRDDDVPEASLLAGRLQRAQDNMFQSLPLFIGAVLVAHAEGRDGGAVFLGAQLFFWGRLLYVPVYALGLKYVRTLVWGVSVAGLVTILVKILTAFPMHAG
jgi:uncharacterized MAPEG superfamily protein